MQKLFEPFTLGDLPLRNRIVMAPMTRNRAKNQIQQEMAVEHYRLRASAGLIIAEASQVSARGQASADTPGLYTDEQTQAWKAVVEAVHSEGGKIVVQLAHAGRLTHSDYHGLPPVAPSNVKPLGFIRTPLGSKPYESPWVPSDTEVRTLVDEFACAARRAQAAGFDGVEIHAAHGFLIDQFIQSGTNLRSDRYGGSPQNRIRLALEILEAVQGFWDKRRIGMTISPGGNHKGIHDENPVETFSLLVREASAMQLGYLHVADQPLADVLPSTFLRPLFRGPLIVSEGYTKDTANAAIEAGTADLVAFGRPFTANPDLVEKFRSDAPLDLPDPKTYYSGERAGYVE